MNWIIKTLANKDTYYAAFIGTLVIYAMIGTVGTGLVVSYAPNFVGRYLFLLMCGAMVLAYVSRVAHNLAYAKLNGDNK